MDAFISGLLYAVSGRCRRLAEQLQELHDELPSDDSRADAARAMARRQQSRMASEAKSTERLADGILEVIRDSVDAGPVVRRREMSRYRGSVAASRFVEYYVIPFLRHFDETAMELTDTCRRIAEKVDWPHGSLPLVAPGATGYFFFISEVGEELILAPALAGNSQLPLPDLVHEMAHPLVRNNERRQTLLGAWGTDDFVRRRVTEALGESEFSHMAARHWLAHGVEEIACDIVAAWVCGSSYAWQHIRWCCGGPDGASVYNEGDYHPPDHIRFEAIMRALSQVTSSSDFEELGAAWDVAIGGYSDHTEIEPNQPLPDPYPLALVLELADEVIRGCRLVGIRPFPDELDEDDPRRLFDRAWRQLRNDPRGFHDGHPV